MKRTSNRSEANAEKLGGKIKKNVGRAIGNEQMEMEGRAKEIRGQAAEQSIKARERGRGAAQELGGKVKNRVGRVIDNEQMQVEGKAKELEGQARQKLNKR